MTDWPGQQTGLWTGRWKGRWKGRRTGRRTADKLPLFCQASQSNQAHAVLGEGQNRHTPAVIPPTESKQHCSRRYPLTYSSTFPTFTQWVIAAILQLLPAWSSQSSHAFTFTCRVRTAILPPLPNGSEQGGSHYAPKMYLSG